ncbi:MAG TPA: VOC family protein [Candidatus Angelobacter sp.]|jgi:hypothetical protein
MNAPNYFEIQADDPSRAATFYREIFGWKFTKAEGLPVEYWRIETEGPRGGLLERPAKTPPSQHGTNAFVAVPGVCWQGYFIDTEGNTFGIFQPDPAAK